LKEHGFTACEKTRLRHRKVKGHDLQPAEKCLLLYQGTTLVVPPASQNHEGFSPCVCFEGARLHRPRKNSIRIKVLRRQHDGRSTGL
jgi:hypothetical protein